MTSLLLKAKVTLLTIVIALLLAQPIAAQVKKRIIPFPEWTKDQQDADITLEVVQIRVAGKLITLGEPFEADENWLKNMTLVVRNVSKSPIFTFGFGGGLLEGIDEELPPGRNFENRINWSYGSGFNPKSPNGLPLRPGASVKLIYRDASESDRKALSKPGEGTFCKLDFVSPATQLVNGTMYFSGTGIRFLKKGRR